MGEWRDSFAHLLFPILFIDMTLLDKAIQRTFNAGLKLNSGSLSYPSGSVQVNSIAVVGYGFMEKYEMDLAGYEQNLEQISVIIPQSSSTNVLRPNLVCSLQASRMSGSYAIDHISNYSPTHVWLTLRGRKDVEYKLNSK